MIGGALEDVPRSTKLFAVASVISAAMLMVAQTLLLTTKKNVCSYQTFGGTADQIEKQLDAACGSVVKLNTDRDYPFVIYFASVLFTGLLWLVVVSIALKQYLWDVLKNHTSRGLDTGLLLYSVFGTFGLVFLVVSYIFVASNTARTCQNVPSKECTSRTYNDDLKGWLSVPVIVFGLLAIVPLWSVFRSRQFKE